MEDFEQSSSRRHQFSVNGRSPSEAIIDAVSAVKDTPAIECPPLYETVDTDALDEIFDGRDSGSVTFEFADCTITLQANESIYVEEHE